MSMDVKKFFELYETAIKTGVVPKELTEEATVSLQEWKDAIVSRTIVEQVKDANDKTVSEKSNFLFRGVHIDIELVTGESGQLLGIYKVPSTNKTMNDHRTNSPHVVVGEILATITPGTVYEEKIYAFRKQFKYTKMNTQREKLADKWAEEDKKIITAWCSSHPGYGRVHWGDAFITFISGYAPVQNLSIDATNPKLAQTRKLFYQIGSQLLANREDGAIRAKCCSELFRLNINQKQVAAYGITKDDADIFNYVLDIFTDLQAEEPMLIRFTYIIEALTYMIGRRDKLKPDCVPPYTPFEIRPKSAKPVSVGKNNGFSAFDALTWVDGKAALVAEAQN